MFNLKDIKKTIDSANINFLIGAGLSDPFLETLDNIEVKLKRAEDNKDNSEIFKIKKEYFEKSMVGNLKIIDNVADKNKDKVLSSYEDFYKRVNNILLKRESSILTKQVNIFTTNVDIFSEKALENTGIEFNDGFQGRFNPIFNFGNFKKSYFRKSLHYENTSEIPVFNILKLHGSLTWKYDKKYDKIFLDNKLELTKDVEKNKKIDFIDAYNKLTIVNPTEKKFEVTLLMRYYYDLLRIYSNELEKENSVLFVMGFSFSDPHIRELTERVAGSNPTLKVYIFAHSKFSKSLDTFGQIKNKSKNRNIEIIIPENDEHYDLETINRELFEKVISFEQDLEINDDATNMEVIEENEK